MRVRWMPHASRDLKRLDQREADRIVDAVDRFAATGQGSVKHLASGADLLRLRVGDYRIIYTLTATPDTMTVLAVRRRDQAYR